MARTGHSAVCEACSEHVRKHTDNIVVGRKASGQQRVIHDRPRCRQRWERIKAERMAKWPEVRAALAGVAVAPAGVLDKPIPVTYGPPPGEPVVAVPGNVNITAPGGVALLRTAALKAPPPDVEATVRNELRVTVAEQQQHKEAPPSIEAVAGVTTAATAASKEESMATPSPSNRRKRLNYRPELDRFLVDYFSRNKLQRGAGAVVYGILKETRPELLHDLDGREVVPNSLFQHAQALIAEAHSGPLAKVPPEPVDAVQDGQRRADAVQHFGRIMQWCLARLCELDVTALETLNDLAQDVKRDER